MPSNRRNGPNRQTPTRRPKVAGRRKRDATYGEALQTEAQEVQAPQAPQEAQEACLAAGEEAATSDEASASREAASVEATPAEAEAVGSSGGEPERADVPMMMQIEAGQPKAANRVPTWRGSSWALWVATVVFAGLAVWFGIESYVVRYSGAAANEALVSAGATSEVNGQISDAVEKLFSYDFNDTAKTENAARDLLVGGAVQRYDELFKVVKEQAPQQQLIVTTVVKSSAVTRLQGDRAELLLFVDQHAMRANTGESNTGPAQISVSAEKQGDRWKITQITLR